MASGKICLLNRADFDNENQYINACRINTHYQLWLLFDNLGEFVKLGNDCYYGGFDFYNEYNESIYPETKTIFNNVKYI